MKITTFIQSDWSGFRLLIIGLFTHHIRWRMKRKAPGTTRSSLPTLHRRRKTTIPGISSSRSFRRPYLPSNRSRFSAIFNVGRDQTVPYPRITGRRELEPYSGISLKLETNASRLVEVVVAFRGAHFRNSVPVDRGFSPSSSRPNLSEISRALFPSNERAFDATKPHSGPPMKKLNHVGDLVWIDLQIIFQRWEREKTQSFSLDNKEENEYDSIQYINEICVLWLYIYIYIIIVLSHTLV